MWGENRNTLIMVLLDWEKAFDKVSREGLFSAMHRLSLPGKYQNVIKKYQKA